MQTLKNILPIGILMFLVISFTGKDTKTIEIKTSTVCGECKERIERELVFEKGIKEVKVNLDAKMVTVKYRTNKTDPDKIRKALSKLGYWADDIPADEVGYNKLPKCCKDDGCGKK
ncbi:MAG TPA: heavy-metal-associated domain-containing protein [Flavobacteriales bacterium]|nr:heavy-metal-associated domain-containing protein [Flavobacteriales bacterium]